MPKRPPRTKCAWCGAPVIDKQTRCPECAQRLKDYKWYCAHIFKTSSTSLLTQFRNLCLDLKYNMPGAELLPKDLDYQFDRVSRYLSGDSD